LLLSLVFSLFGLFFQAHDRTYYVTGLPVNSSHGQLVTQSTRHAVNSSQRGGQLVTSKQTNKHQSRTAAAV